MGDRARGAALYATTAVLLAGGVTWWFRAALMAPLLRGTNPIVDGRKKDRTFVKRQLWLLFADFTAHASGRMIA